MSVFGARGGESDDEIYLRYVEACEGEDCAFVPDVTLRNGKQAQGIICNAIDIPMMNGTSAILALSGSSAGGSVTNNPSARGMYGVPSPCTGSFNDHAEVDNSTALT